MKKNILFLSNLYPSLAHPNQATFNYQQVRALSALFDVSVLSPVPWVDRSAVKAVRQNCNEEASTAFPVYWYTPGTMRALYGRMMLRSVAATAEKMHRKSPFDLVFGAWLYPDGWVAGKLAEKWNIPCFLKVHGTDVNRLTANTALTRVSLQAIDRCRAVICVSQALKIRLVELGVSAEKCHVVYNGIDEQIFYPRDKTECRKSLGLNTEERIILYVGNLLKTKGLEELAIAFARMARVSSDVRLILVGTGPWEQSLREKLSHDGVGGRALFAGSVSHREIGIWMNAADVLCLPSYMEGVPNVVLESLGCNTPVVSTAVGGVPEIACVDNRIFQVRPKDPIALQESLELVLQGTISGAKRSAVQSWQKNASTLSSIMLAAL